MEKLLEFHVYIFTHFRQFLMTKRTVIIWIIIFFAFITDDILSKLGLYKPDEVNKFYLLMPFAVSIIINSYMIINDKVVQVGDEPVIIGREVIKYSLLEDIKSSHYQLLLNGYVVIHLLFINLSKGGYVYTDSFMHMSFIIFFYGIIILFYIIGTHISLLNFDKSDLFEISITDEENE